MARSKLQVSWGIFSWLLLFLCCSYPFPVMLSLLCAYQNPLSTREKGGWGKLPPPKLHLLSSELYFTERKISVSIHCVRYALGSTRTTACDDHPHCAGMVGAAKWRMSSMANRLPFRTNWHLDKTRPSWPLEKIRCCIGFAWQGFGSGRGYRGGFCGKVLEASPMSNRANASRLQDGPAAGQG